MFTWRDDTQWAPERCQAGHQGSGQSREASPGGREGSWLRSIASWTQVLRRVPPGRRGCEAAYNLSRKLSGAGYAFLQAFVPTCLRVTWLGLPVWWKGSTGRVGGGQTRTRLAAGVDLRSEVKPKASRMGLHEKYGGAGHRSLL